MRISELIGAQPPKERAQDSERRRLDALRSYGILDTPHEPEFDDIAAMAAQACATPIAYVGFLDERRQWFKAEIGYGVRELPHPPSICSDAIRVEDMLYLPDLAEHPDYADSIFLKEPFQIRFYAGVPLKTPDGLAIGTVCVLDRVPRHLNEQQCFILRALARTVMAQLDMRKAIAAQVRAEARMLESEDHYRHTVELNPQVPWTCDPRGHVTSYSQRWLELTGQKPGEPDGSGWATALHPDDRQPTVERFLASLASGEPVDIDYRIFVAKTGLYRWMRARAQPRRNAGGEIIRWYGVVEDVHDRKVAEADLRDSEVRYRTLFDSIDVGFCIIEFFDGPHGPLSDYVHVEANAAFEHHAGISNVVGRKVRDIVPDEADGWVERYRHVLLTGEPIRFERELIATERHLELAAFRVDPASRRQVAILFQDASARKSAEVALQLLNETLEARVDGAVAELRATEEALRQSQKMEAVGQLTGGLAHDFNNLLTGISGSLALVQSRVSQGRLTEIDRYVAAAQGAAKRASALTHRLLAFSRRQTLDPKPTDTNALVTGMEDLIRRTIGLSVTLEIVGAVGLWATMVDPPQLENALLNLCINARDAMPNGGRITIETANKWLDPRAARERDLIPGQYVSLCVTDNGAGMSPDVIAKAFDPFFTTKPIGQGTGLGLSMIYGFVRQSGGQARIYSELGQGTTVCLYLPRYHGPAEEIELPADLVGAQTAKHAKTVLVVDDEPTVRMLVTEVLKDLGYAALQAVDSPSGLKVLLSDAQIDLLVSDVGLPGGMNGRQMADAARAKRPDLKVLFITGYAENAVVGNGHLDPGMHVMTKPFDIDVLSMRIQELIVD